MILTFQHLVNTYRSLEPLAASLTSLPTIIAAIQTNLDLATAEQSQTDTMASKPAIPQNDNVAHALAGAGGGVLSMVLTYVLQP